MAILKELTVVTGSYKSKDGSEKKRYLTIGHLHTGEYGEYVTLESHVNLAALPRKDGDSRVMVNLYDPKPSEKPKGKAEASYVVDKDESEIPF